METSSNQPQLFQSQPQTQLSQMQQQTTPMEQQQSSQQAPPSQLTIGQQGSLFQTITNHSQSNMVAQSQLAPPQQTGLLLCTTDMNSQTPSILFSTQTQGPPPIGVGIPQSDTTEPMSFQDGSTGSGSVSSESQPPNLFQDQQPMQVVPSSSTVQSSQPVELFLPPASLSNLQNTLGTQELGNPAPASGPTIFVVQRGVGVVGNPGQQPPEQLFQTTVTGNVAPQGQPDLFVFGIQNDSQLLSTSGPAQNQAQSASHMQTLLDQPMAQAPTSVPTTIHDSLQAQIQTAMHNAMQTSPPSGLQSTLQAPIDAPNQTNLQIQTNLQNALQGTISATSNMDKIEDLLESLQKQ